MLARPPLRLPPLLESRDDLLANRPYLETDLDAYRVSETAALPAADLEFLRGLRVVICTVCRIYLTPTVAKIRRHLAAEHSLKYPFLSSARSERAETLLAALAAFLAESSPLTLSTTLLNDPLYESPPSYRFYYRNLPLALDGSGCPRCSFIALSATTVYRHSRSCLTGLSPYRRRGSTLTASRLRAVPILALRGLPYNRTLLFLPRFARKPPLPSIAPLRTLPSTEATRERLSAFTLRYRLYELEAARTLPPDTNADKELALFNRLTGYYRLFLGKGPDDLRYLLGLLRPLDDDAASRLRRAASTLSSRAYARLERLSLSVRIAINNPFPSEAATKVRAFKALYPRSRSRYLRLLLSLLAFLLTLLELKGDEPLTRLLPLTFSPTLYALLSELKALLTTNPPPRLNRSERREGVLVDRDGERRESRRETRGVGSGGRGEAEGRRGRKAREGRDESREESYDEGRDEGYEESSDEGSDRGSDGGSDGGSGEGSDGEEDEYLYESEEEEATVEEGEEAEVEKARARGVEKRTAAAAAVEEKAEEATATEEEEEEEEEVAVIGSVVGKRERRERARVGERAEIEAEEIAEADAEAEAEGEIEEEEEAEVGEGGGREREEAVGEKRVGRLEEVVLLLITALLRDPFPTGFTDDSAFRNPLLLFFLLRILDAPTIREAGYTRALFLDERRIVSLLSLFLYNARLYALAYLEDIFATLPPRQALRSTYSFLRANLSLTADNYFREFFLLRRKLLSATVNRISSYKPIGLTEDPEVLLVEKRPLSLRALPRLFRRLLLELEGTLFIDLLFYPRDPLLPLDLTRIRGDSKDTRDLGGELVSSDPYLASLRTSLIERVLDPSTAAAAYFATRRKGGIERRIEEYARRLDAFLSRLLLATYLLSSSPPRGAELVLVRFRNAALDTPRNLFFELGPRLFSLETSSLLKSRDLTKVDYSTIRYLPPRLTRVLLYYLTYLVPLREYLNVTYLRRGLLSPRLFASPLRDRPYTSATLSSLLRTYTARFLDLELGIRVYRHLITYLIKDRVLRTRPDLASPLRGSNGTKATARASNIEDVISGHSTKVTELNYAREEGYFSNKTRETTLRSLDYARVFFRYYGLDTLPSIEESIEAYRAELLADTREKEERERRGAEPRESEEADRAARGGEDEGGKRARDSKRREKGGRKGEREEERESSSGRDEEVEGEEVEVEESPLRAALRRREDYSLPPIPFPSRGDALEQKGRRRRRGRERGEKGGREEGEGRSRRESREIEGRRYGGLGKRVGEKKIGRPR